MFKHLSIYRLAKPVDTELGVIEAALEGAQFVPCTATQDKAVGFVPASGEAFTDHVRVVNSRHLLMRVRIETKSVPSAAVRKKAQEAADKIEGETGRRPGRKETKALREDALLALLPSAFPRVADVMVWVDLATSRVMFDATSQGRVDDAITAVVRALPDFPLSSLNTVDTPMAGMTRWLTAVDAEEWPMGLAVERACELRSSDEERAVVRFKNHHLFNDEVRRHIAEGKLPTRLDMSYDGRVAFTLTESLQLKGLSFLEGVINSSDQDERDSGFETDALIATSELTTVIDALIPALGGLMQESQPT